MTIKLFALAALAALALQAHAQTATAPAAAPASAQKKALIAKVLELQRPAVETMARVMAEQPAQQLMQQAAIALQRLPEDRREVLAREIEADARKYADEVNPIVRTQALKAAPLTIGAMLEERMDETELRQLVAALESPGFKKFQAMSNDMQRVLAQRILAESKAAVEPKVKALEASMRQRLAPPAAATPSPAAAPASRP
jgi:uncharacterized protein